MFTIFENLLIYSQFFSKVFQLKKLYSHFLAQSCESWMSSDISTFLLECGKSWVRVPVGSNQKL
jgi:hypothetical protein